MKTGVDGVEGVEALLYRVPETLASEVLEQMKAPPKDPSIPEITAAELVGADGWTAITQLAHHGMLFVPVGYTFGAGMFKMDSIRGGSPYGAGVFAGDGSRQPSETELALAEHQGKYMATIVKRLAHA
ncbi:unnamed protein product [Linum tenue]|uniref:Uncharacterized protein n=1 Tax=Linum tenue TaxID=586396 RepID=A0AAV0PRS9_9ROSI|nr:unnamed protein product [Linum tenue]CAI0473513.1 unnamed protein product [Linum tenue]